MEDLWEQIGNPKGFVLFVGAVAVGGAILGAIVCPPKHPEKLQWSDWKPLVVGAALAALVGFGVWLIVGFGAHDSLSPL
jgi:hypothetical protein